MINRKLLIYTMCRSGNHAIIFWILENLGGTNEMIKDCCYWNRSNSVYFYNNCNHISYNFMNQYNYMLKSYEDMSVHPVTIDNKPIIIIRDFLNLISSRYKKYGDKLGLNWSYLQDYTKIKNLWKEHAKLIQSNKAIGILYNKWVVDKDYRDKVGEELGIPNIMDKTDYVSTIGEGSSFNGVALETDKKNYLNRFESISLPEKIKMDLLQDDELIQLNNGLFETDIFSSLLQSKS